jgi:hypothetical protein
LGRACGGAVKLCFGRPGRHEKNPRNILLVSDDAPFAPGVVELLRAAAGLTVRGKPTPVAAQARLVLFAGKEKLPEYFHSHPARAWS